MPDAYDATLAAIATSRPLRTIDDVVEVMRALDRAFAPGDGVKWFNLLYLRVTESVKDDPPDGGWLDGRWLERLDVVFAGLYFGALAAWGRERKAAARCWRALFDARRRTDVARIQFALAGMNAHINHDLALALLATSEERGAMPERGSPQHRDFERVNSLLERVEAQVKAELLSRQVREVDRHFGRVDDVIALWKVRKARDTAWTNGELLWHLREVSLASRKFVQNLDRLVGLSSKGLLVPTEIA
jgi:hypothetical protein